MFAQARGRFGDGTDPPPDSKAAEVVTGDLGGVGVDRGTFCLRHLADLLVQRHPAQQAGSRRRRSTINSGFDALLKLRKR